MTKSQIPKEYTTNEKNSSNFKGQLKISQHIKHNLVDKSKFYCKYRKLTMDTLINQTIRYTYKLLMQKQNHLSGLLRNIAEYDAMLQSFGVENKDIFLSEIKKIRYSKLNFHYKKVMELSSLIIKSESIKSDSSLSNNNSFSYFLDIAELWENYLLKVLQRNLPEYYIYSPNEEGGEYLLEDSDRKIRQIRPDIMIKKDGKVVAILDAKYKSYNQIGQYANCEKFPYFVSRDDLYQMSTYLYHYADSNEKVIGLFVSAVEDEGKIEFFSKNKNHSIGVLNLDIKQFDKKDDEKDNFSRDKIKEEEIRFIEKIKKVLE
jgi:5-methylcytosine-specific restriction enzyme subunit McrC